MAKPPSKLRFLPPIIALALLEAFVYWLTRGFLFPTVSWALVGILFWWVAIPLGYRAYQYSKSRKSVE